MTTYVAGLWRGLDRLQHQVRRQRDQATQFERRLTVAQRHIQSDRQNRLASLARVLRSVSPQATLNRGYAIARVNGHILRSADAARPGDTVVLQLAKGQIDAEIRPS